jgi:hypothetical protein
VATQNFHGTDGTIPAGWSQDTAITDPLYIDSNELRGTNNGTLGIIYNTASTVVRSMTTVSGSSATTLCGPAFCLNGAGNGYYFDMGGVIFLLTAGTTTILAFTTPAGSPSDIGELIRSGNDVVAKINGTEVGRATGETTYTSGYSGVGISGGPFARLSLWDDGASGVVVPVLDPMTQFSRRHVGRYF